MPVRLHLHGPWLAAGLVTALSLHLLRIEGFRATSGGWVLLGSAAICFSIGCVCHTSWHVARGNSRENGGS